MTNVYLVRHTQSIGNIEKRLTGRVDYKVTEEGKKQVKKLTNGLKAISFSAVYSSPFLRAIETVKELAIINNLKINIEDDLSEMYFGIYDGFRWTEVNEINPKIHENHIRTNEIMQIPSQEVTEQVADRMWKAIIRMVNQNKGKNILIASHGVAIEAFLRRVSQVPFTEQREEYSQKNTSVNIIQFDEEKGTFEIKVLNSIIHLQEQRIEGEEK